MRLRGDRHRTTDPRHNQNKLDVGAFGRVLYRTYLDTEVESLHIYGVFRPGAQRNGEDLFLVSKQSDLRLGDRKPGRRIRRLDRISVHDRGRVVDAYVDGSAFRGIKDHLRGFQSHLGSLGRTGGGRTLDRRRIGAARSVRGERHSRELLAMRFSHHRHPRCEGRAVQGPSSGVPAQKEIAFGAELRIWSVLGAALLANVLGHLESFVAFVMLLPHCVRNRWWGGADLAFGIPVGSRR